MQIKKEMLWVLASRVPVIAFSWSFKRIHMQIKKVGVLGCGLMGSGIAQVAATAGFDVTVLEVEQKLLDKGFAGIEKSLAKFAEKGTLKETPQAVSGAAQRHDQQAETWPTATSSSRRSSRMSKKRRRCTLRSIRS